jgi:signal transduction histidine kinase
MLESISATSVLSTEQLESFMDNLLEAMLTGDPGILESRIDEWFATPSMFVPVDKAFSEYQERGLVSVLHALRTAAFAIIQKHAGPEQALLYQNNLEAQFCHILEYAAFREFAAVIENLTKSQDEVRESFRLLEQTRSNFVTVAAQELRTPLTLIDGYMQMLKETLPDDDPDSEPLVSGVESGIQKLRIIIDELVDISMIDTEMMLLHYQPVKIKDLLAEAQKIIEPHAVERLQKIEVNTLPIAEETVYIDRERLVQAIIHVLDNSVKYTPEGGSIVIDGRMLPGFIELSVADTGFGIDPADQALLFDKFGAARRTENTADESQASGAGLGLPLAKGILEAHGGAIWVESEGYDEKRCPGSV